MSDKTICDAIAGCVLVEGPFAVDNPLLLACLALEPQKPFLRGDLGCYARKNAQNNR